jgi:hypothetical protein
MIKYEKLNVLRRSSHYSLPLMWFFSYLFLAGLCLGFKSFGNQNPSGISTSPGRKKESNYFLLCGRKAKGIMSLLLFDATGVFSLSMPTQAAHSPPETRMSWSFLGISATG